MRLAAVVACLDAGRIPVVTPIAVGPLNVNADEAATAIAASVAADRVVFVSDVAGVFLEGAVLPAHPCRSREPSSSRAAHSTAASCPKLMAAVQAARSGLSAEIGETAVVA